MELLINLIKSLPKNSKNLKVLKTPNKSEPLYC